MLGSISIMSRGARGLLSRSEVCLYGPRVVKFNDSLRERVRCAVSGGGIFQLSLLDSYIRYSAGVSFFFLGGGRAFVERAQLAVPFRWRV